MLPTLTDLNPLRNNWYSFMISLDRCNISFNFGGGGICFLNKTKHVNVKLFNLIILVIRNASSTVQNVTLTKNGMLISVDVSVIM